MEAGDYWNDEHSEETLGPTKELVTEETLGLDVTLRIL